MSNHYPLCEGGSECHCELSAMMLGEDAYNIGDSLDDECGMCRPGLGKLADAWFRGWIYAYEVEEAFRAAEKATQN